MDRIKAILFDMDGVLIDAKDWHYEALNKALRIFGFEISRYDHVNTFDGLPTKVKLEMIGKTEHLPKQLFPLISDMKQKYTRQQIEEKCTPVFCHEYALSRLKREGYKIAVCSNSIKNTIELMMQRSNLYPYLDLICSNEDVKNAKPDPEIYIKAMDELGMMPEQCVVVEDNPNGIEAGRRSGAFVMEVSGVHDVSYWNISRFIATCEGVSI